MRARASVSVQTILRHFGSRDVLVSLSTANFPGRPEALQSIMDSLAGLAVRVVVTTGPAVDPAGLRAPANAELHRYLPHDRLLPQASLVVVPMHPMLDQRMIGEAVARTGAGAVVAKGDIATRLRGEVARLLADGPHRTAAAGLGARIRERDNTAVAADHLTGLRELPRPVQPRVAK